jgi:hypothetical protein
MSAISATMSCSPAGAGGFTGCTQKFVEAAYKDKRRGREWRALSAS